MSQVKRPEADVLDASPLTDKAFPSMKKQITFIAPGQTAKALILVYLTFSVPIVLLGALVAFFRYGSVELSTVTSALLLNAIVGFILLWIACHAYNWVASRFGGIEIVLSDAPEEA